MNDDLPAPDGPITASSGHVSSCASAERGGAWREICLQRGRELARARPLGFGLREAAIDDRDQLAGQRRVARRDARQWCREIEHAIAQLLRRERAGGMDACQRAPED